MDLENVIHNSGIIDMSTGEIVIVDEDVE
jgi:hypothetical protein